MPDGQWAEIRYLGVGGQHAGDRAGGLRFKSLEYRLKSLKSTKYEKDR